MFLNWQAEDYASKIYNDDYPIVDPDYLMARPHGNAVLLTEQFGQHRGMLRHLDYGGGNGQLSKILKDAGWNSTAFDPYGNSDDVVSGTYNLITVFEVFEHVTQLHELLDKLAGYLDEPGLIFFSTLVSDEHVAPDMPLDWWYAAPRNGHVSLFSIMSLELLGFSAGLNYCNFSQNLHAYWKFLPVWAAPLFDWGNVDSATVSEEFK
jgi:2-polyprenyl-3-methyl-5-hydroxy-6-metoxy-1,4-benzoquinol methylase